MRTKKESRIWTSAAYATACTCVHASSSQQRETNASEQHLEDCDGNDRASRIQRGSTEERERLDPLKNDFGAWAAKHGSPARFIRHRRAASTTLPPLPPRKNDLKQRQSEVLFLLTISSIPFPLDSFPPLSFPVSWSPDPAPSSSYRRGRKKDDSRKRKTKQKNVGIQTSLGESMRECQKNKKQFTAVWLAW